ncbi:MAG: RNA polymerase sigma factor [Myxococcales bacterium]
MGTAARALEAPRADAQTLAEACACAKAGDGAAYRQVVELAHATVYRLALRLVGDEDEAADIAQETFVRAWSTIEELREPAAALGWLCRIARNLARDRTRGWWWSRRRPLGSDDEAALRLVRSDGGQRPDDALASAQLGAQVRRALAALGEKHRVVLELREVDGMDYEEIAAALGVPVGTVESRLHRARKALAKRLERRVNREDAR